MNNDQRLIELAEEIREIVAHQGTNKKDLVFNPVNGFFFLAPSNTFHGEGDIVTEMIRKGFAAENEDIVIFLREDDYYEDERTYERYNGSYAQNVEGWSDQDIDVVFDGNSDAYWNID